MFREIDRECMREIFQPSRIVLAIVYDRENGRYNFLPVAFNMYAGYNPLTFCFAIHNINHSFKLFKEEEKYCISVPGEKLAKQILESGIVTGKDWDKFALFNLTPFFIDENNTCGINECIINAFCDKTAFIPVSDHALVVGEMKSIYRNYDNKERNLLSISNWLEGYELLEQKGIHRIGVKLLEKQEEAL